MFDAYAVAIKLSLVNEVSKGIAAITTDFSALNSVVANTQGKLDGVHGQLANIQKLGAIGGGVAALGFGGLDLLKGPYEEAKRLAQAKTDFENLNLSTFDNSAAYAQAAAMSHKLLGTNITDNIKQINDLHTAFGDLHHALKSSDAYAKYTFAAKVANGGQEVAGLANDSVKALEQRGGKVINDDDTFKDELRLQSQVYFGSKGKVSGKDFFAASQTGGMAYSLYDKEYLYGEFAALMKSKSGATAGTAGMTAFSSLIGGHMDNKAKGFLADLGMLQVGVSKAQVDLVNHAVNALAIPDKERTKLMTAMMPVTGGLKDQFLDIAAHRPDVLINDYLVPAIRQKYGMNMSDEEVGMLVSKNFNRGTSKELGELIVNHLKFTKDANIFANAKDYGSAYDAYLKSPQGAETAAAESWKNLSTMIGVTFIPKITEALGSLAHGLEAFAQWTEEHPHLTTALTTGFIALGASMAIGGSLMLATAGIQGLGLALRFATIGGPAGILTLGQSLIGVAGGLTTLTTAAGLFASAYAGWKIGEAVGNKIDKNVQESSGYGLSSMRDWLAHTHLGKVTHLFDFGKDEALHFVQAPSLTHPTIPTQAAITPTPQSPSSPLPNALPSSPPIAPDNARAPVTQQGTKGPTIPYEGKSRIEELLESINASMNKGMNVSFQNYIDSKAVASHMIGPNATGPTNFNVTAARMSPLMATTGLY